MVCDVVEADCVKKGWTVASRGVDVPPRLVHPSLLKVFDHTRPDLVLIGRSTKKELEVVLVEVTVPFDTDKNLQAANTRKQQVYLPLMEAIQKSNAAKSVQVSIAVVIVGTRGVIPTFWGKNIQPLKLTSNQQRSLARRSSVAALKGSQWIWGLWAAQAHGGGIDEQPGYG